MMPLLSRLWTGYSFWCKQKRYMALGSIQKPKSWSSCQVATRLTTLNCYLAYLPGTAQSFKDDKMKDILIEDMKSPAYHHLMARAKYGVDAHSYIWKLRNICRMLD
jgi:hypothetical protein